MRNIKPTLSRQKKAVDRNLFFLILGLVVLGLIVVADVSAPQALNNFGDKFFLFKNKYGLVKVVSSYL